MLSEVKLPVLGEDVDSGTVVKVLVSVGDAVTKDTPVLDLDTEKASVEVPASASGKVKEIRVKEGDTVKVGQVLLTLEEAAEAEAAAEGMAAIQPPPQRQPEVIRFRKEEPAPTREAVAHEIMPRETVPAAPSVRRIARELGIDINEVTGTGDESRITDEDVRNYARSIILNATARNSAVQPVTTALPDFSRWGEIERKPVNSVRRKTAEHLSEAWTSIPHVTHFDSADVTELERLRETFARRVEESGGKLTVTAILVKVAASALKIFPQFNASFDPEREEIIHKKYCNIGVAVDTDRGLLVPVIRNADQKNILELSVELTQVAEKARNRKLAAVEMQGGTFTITNLGGIGGSAFTPIINSPEAAILGAARASHQAVFSGGQFQPRLMLPLALSFDHRIVDGADAARFLRWVARALEQPFVLSLEG